MKFGNLETENNVFAAPMAGVTDEVYRAILKSMGAGVMYTEMVSAKALCYKDKKTEQIMRIYDFEQPIGVQIFGSEPDIMAAAAEIVCEKTDASFIDINMGCPVPKVAGNGEGSALLKNPLLAGEIVHAVSNRVKIPVTVKIRSGWDENSVNAVDVAKRLEQAGASLIAVHGRTRKQMYSGKSDKNVIKAVKQAVSVPVVGNGDIMTADDAAAMINETGCDGVMPARGLMGNPWLIKQCVSLLQTGKQCLKPSFEDIIDMAVYHTRRLTEVHGVYKGIREARTHLTWYVKGRRGAAAVKNLLTQAETAEEIEDILNRWYNELSDKKY